MPKTTNPEQDAQENQSAPWQQQWDSALMPTYGTPQLELVRGEGSFVFDANGAQYLDLLSGIAVNALGHAHPAIVRAVTEQVSTLGHVSNNFAHPQVITLATRLKGLIAQHLDGEWAHDPQSAQVFFANSGAEANEAAFKIARATGRTKILAAERGFHGRTMGALALTGQPDKQAQFQPLPGGVEYYPYGDIEALRRMADEDTAAIVLESIQGETGVIPTPEGFLTEVRQLCDELGILMIVDEVQAGMGRTGAWFGYQVEQIVPDVITLAKGLGGGMPIGACIALPPAQLLVKGSHGTTFGGNPIACAAANAVITTIEDEHILDNVTEIGAYITSELEKDPSVTTIRGRGLMLGVVLDSPLEVDPLEYGVIINRPAPDVLRIVPPLNLSREDARLGVEKIKKMLNDNRAAQSGAPTKESE
ncbi:acetylornithine transaminase [Corynebacterium sp. 320]|uniref:acetylornithine transaminase n=1 Tax=Corynebacterium TaxID=1716 RepID=UPI00125CC090|nr:MULTISPECIES: acetylornithine transaminase [Corynebacterium]KAB1502580.1 acetylornithine transaminase [Corynebacterium sp. 320]KAB3526187.1 acetylornithine transaminase [Corynebacterium sp. 250]QNP92921.1 acetylornithine transaminase [Corynebacterium zhongnanshanii]